MLGFGLGSQTAEQNVRLIGAFSKWRDISALDPATLARTLSGDGVDVLIDAGGFASSAQLQALTRFESGLRVSWLGNPSAILAPLYDVRLAAADYPVLDDVAKTWRKARDRFAFGADVTLAQLDSRTVALWSAVLALVPDAKLVLRGRDMESSANIGRLSRRFRREPRGADRSAPGRARKPNSTRQSMSPCCRITPRRRAPPPKRWRHGVPAIAMAGEPFGSFMTGRWPR